MAVSARVATGVQAIRVVISENGRTISAIIPREALEECWEVGPEQQDLLHAFSANRNAIEAAVRHQSKASRGELFLVRDLTDTGPTRKRSAAVPRANDCVVTGR